MLFEMTLSKSTKTWCPSPLKKSPKRGASSLASSQAAEDAERQGHANQPSLPTNGRAQGSLMIEVEEGYRPMDSGQLRGSSADVKGLARMMLSSPRSFQSPRKPFAPFLNLDDVVPPSPVSDVVGNVLGSATSTDLHGVARRLEIFVETCKQEFDNLRYVKEEQMLKLKEALMDALKSDELQQSRGRMLEALIEGQGEEVQVVSEQLQQAQEEQMKVSREKRRLKEELIRTKRELEAARLRVSEMELEGPRSVAACKEQEAKRQRQLLDAAHEVQALRSAFAETKHEVQQAELGWKAYLQSLEGQVAELAQVTEGYQKVLEENRKLYNEVQDLKGNIRVYCRVRPLHDHEADRPSCVEFLNPNGDIMVNSSVKANSRRGFTFDKVFGPATSQEAIFADTRPLIRSVLDGFNVCIFAYGQTGSGKTFTMAGPNNPLERDWGVNVRALNDLFGIGKERKQSMKYDVGVQMVEIYNEQVRDLLDSTGNGPRSLEIRNNSQVDGLNVPDATKVPVCSTGDVLRLMDLGMRNRAVACTSLNERSSRSHSVLTVHVQGLDLLSGSVLRGCLHLVDLAGSERIDRSEATGDRLKEAQHINKSLSALGDVIAALANKSPHIPYRNSKLTQLLQDALGKQAKTLMFVHVSPDEESYGETVSTLTFAKRVASVELGASSKNSESAELRESREEIANLKDELVRKTAELEKAQQLKAEADARAKTLAAAAAAASAAPPSRPIAADRRLSESGLAKRALTLSENEAEKNVRVKRLSDSTTAIPEELETASQVLPETRASTGRLTRSRGLPPPIPGARKVLTRRTSSRLAAKSMETAFSGSEHESNANPGGAMVGEEIEGGAVPQRDNSSDDRAGVPQRLLPEAASARVEPPESSACDSSEVEECSQTAPLAAIEQGLAESSDAQEAVLQLSGPLSKPSSQCTENGRLEKEAGLVPLLESPPASSVLATKSRDPLRVSSEDFNLPQQESRQRREDQSRAEKGNEENLATPVLLPGGASPVGKGLLFEKQSTVSRLRLLNNSLATDSTSKLPTPRRLTMAGTSIPVPSGRPSNHRRTSSIEDAPPVPVSAIPVPPSRLKQPGAPATAAVGAPRQSGRRQWV